ncbi:histone-lysine N-methyltransferase SETMAR [Trichonephila clavipes]|nr:histone-lysine N-methyltransferase SETMAR [Trichonephila clavipes]
MLLTNLGRPSKNICNRLVKQTEQVFGFRIICLTKTELTDLRRATYCVNGTIQNCFFFRLITADEKWVLYDNPKCKRQRLSSKEPPRRTVKSAIINRNGVILQHRTAQENTEKINGLGWEVLPHPPYSPDIAPMDFYSFRSMQHFFTNKKFQNLDDMKNAISRYFTEKPIDFYRSGIENLHSRWQKAVANEDDYIID